MVDAYLINPTNPITVNLIGIGGTGSTLLTTLARMNHSLIALGHPGLDVSAVDPDRVNQANLGRQLFLESEIGFPKAVALINRVNRTFGTRWKAIPEKYTKNHPTATITISCVDRVDTRFKIADILSTYSGTELERDHPAYWMDFGNSKETGQAILSTVKKVKQPESRKYLPVSTLPFVTVKFGDLLRASENTDKGPSCSLAEALESQDLFINSTLANAGASVIWNMFRKGMLFNRGFFLNLADFRMQPIRIEKPAIEKHRTN